MSVMAQEQLLTLYHTLYDTYGAQGWWPFLDGGYHPHQYNFQKSEDQIFEVCLGSILTQNTTFTSVATSLKNLDALGCLGYKMIKNMPLETLKSAIKPSGYFNQKATYILGFIDFFEQLNGATPLREELLDIKGIGPETADSILLFAYNQPEFKVDAYTKRILTFLGYIKERATYDEIKKMMENFLTCKIKEQKELVIVYQEFHALLVEHGKKFYSKKPYHDAILV